MEYDLGYFDDETCRLEPIDNPFAAKLLPMSPEWTKKNLAGGRGIRSIGIPEFSNYFDNSMRSIHQRCSKTCDQTRSKEQRQAVRACHKISGRRESGVAPGLGRMPAFRR